MTTLFTIVGYDAAGIQRVWASELDEAAAYVSCRHAARDYLRSRPDCGPLASWGFELYEARELAA